MSIKTITLDSGQQIRTSIKKGNTSVCTPLILFNGIGAPLELLSPFVKAIHKMNPNIEVITFDVPGVGGSPTPKLPYRFSGLAKTITQVLDILGYEKVDVLGLSWGGMLATQFAYDYPERCNKLILAATSTGVTSIPPSLEVLKLMASPRRYTDPDFMASIAPTIYGGAFKTNPKLATEYAAKMASSKEETSTLGYLYQTTALYWWSSLYMLPSIKRQTLLLGADDDPIIDLRNMKIMDRLIPNSNLKVIEDGGHLFLLTHLDEVIPVLKKFLEVE